MKKCNLINWASILIVVILLYQIVSFFFSAIPEIPFDKWSIIPILGLISAAHIGKDIYDSRIIAQQLYDGDFLNVASTMDGLQKTNKTLYKKVMSDYKDVIEEKQSDAQQKIDCTVKWAAAEIRNGNFVSFSVKDERKEVRKCTDLRGTIRDIENGTKTWEDAKNTIINNRCYFAMLKVFLNEPKDKLTIEAEAEAKAIQEARDRGLPVQIDG